MRDGLHQLVARGVDDAQDRPPRIVARGRVVLIVPRIVVDHVLAPEPWHARHHGTAPGIHDDRDGRHVVLAVRRCSRGRICPRDQRRCPAGWQLSTGSILTSLRALGIDDGDPPLLRVLSDLRNRQVEQAVGGVVGGLFGAVAGVVKDDLAEDRVVGLGRHERREGRILGVVDADDDLVLGVVGHLVDAGLAPGLDRRRGRLALTDR